MPATPDAVIAHDYASAPCRAASARFACGLAGVVGVCTLLGMALGGAGLLVLALAPGVLILCFLREAFTRAVVPVQMTCTFCEAVGWMVPLCVVLFAGWRAVQPATRLPDAGTCDAAIASYAVTSYFLAGTLEELLKFAALYRVHAAPVVVSPGALVVYGAAAALALAMIENVLYVIATDHVVGLVRGLVVVPGHTLTGMLIGVNLARRRFLAMKITLPNVLAMPVLLHGTYDYVLFLGDAHQDGHGGAALFGCTLALAICIVLSSACYLRYSYVEVVRRWHPKEHSPEDANVWEKIHRGEVRARSPLESCHPG